MGMYWDNGKENGNYYTVGFILGLYWRYIEIMDKKMETTIQPSTWLPHDYAALSWTAFKALGVYGAYCVQQSEVCCKAHAEVESAGRVRVLFIVGIHVA